MTETGFITVIIPVEERTDYLDQALIHYARQSYKNFEVIIASTNSFSVSHPFVRVVVDKKLTGDVAAKRNQILKHGKGEIFVFNDDDVYVPQEYLAEIAKKMKNSGIVSVCGPLLTPPDDSFWQQGSGAVWESYLGSLGAGVYRSRKLPARVVYDYPAANLAIRRKVFEKVGGFEPGLYPGEDTKLCLLIYNQYRKGINYHPELFVYHHRKPLFGGHLIQIGRYGHQRGWFTLSYPDTSLKPRYFMPALLLVYFLSLAFLSLLNFIFSFQLPVNQFIWLPLGLYIFLIFIEGIIIGLRKDFKIAVIAALGIIATHLYYGWRFSRSFIDKIIQKLRVLMTFRKK